jgi:hypothetical protein
MISKFSSPRFPNSALGIERNSVTAVALQGGRQHFDVKQAATVAAPDGVIEPSFTRSNILFPDRFAAIVREVIENAGLMKQKQWSLTLPSNTARTAIFSLESEPASAKEREEILDWKAEQSFGTPAAELRLSMQKISPDKEGRSRYFVTAVRLEVIDEFESALAGMGLRTGLILPRAIGEANWLMDTRDTNDSLLISSNTDGFTALLLRGTEPAVVRSVQCGPGEIDDEVYRLVMFYHDRFAVGADKLDKLMVIGDEFEPSKIQTIASEALGRAISVMSPEDLGLRLPGGGLDFNDLAAPAGLAALGFSR